MNKTTVVYAGKRFFPCWKEITCVYSCCFCLIFVWYKTTGCLSPAAQKKTRTTVTPQIDERPPLGNKHTWLRTFFIFFPQGRTMFLSLSYSWETFFCENSVSNFCWGLFLNGWLGQVSPPSPVANVERFPWTKKEPRKPDAFTGWSFRSCYSSLSICDKLGLELAKF